MAKDRTLPEDTSYDADRVNKGRHHDQYSRYQQSSENRNLPTPHRSPLTIKRLTPGITRRAFNVITAKFTIRRPLARGRVHAVVRLLR